MDRPICEDNKEIQKFREEGKRVLESLGCLDLDFENDEEYALNLFQTIQDVFLKKDPEISGWGHSNWKKESFVKTEKGVSKCFCGSDRVKTLTKQTRSGDESMTVFFTCECGRNWVK